MSRWSYGTNVDLYQPTTPEARCIHCGGQHGLVFNLPRYQDQWCHFSCAEHRTIHWQPPDINDRKPTEQERSSTPGG